jgi:hypothetical protein
MSPPMKILREIIANQVWVIETSFWMFGFLPINNNGLLIKVRKDNGGTALVAVNAPQLTKEMIQEVKDLESTTESKVEYIVESDWHHLYANDWAKEFQTSTVYFPATRAWRIHEHEDFKKQILDRENPVLPGVDTSSLQLIPWLGFVGPAIHHPDEKKRGEYTIYLPEHKLLYIFDILIPHMPWRRFLRIESVPRPPRCNFGKYLKGFVINDPQLCSKSALRLLELDLNIVCYSHGELDYGALMTEKQTIKTAMDSLRSLLLPEDATTSNQKL